MQSERPSGGPQSAAVFGGLVAGAHLANDTITSMVPALLPAFADRFRLTASELAVLAGGFAVSTALPQPFFGSLADRFGGHRVGAVGLAVSAMLIILLGFASSAAWLCALVLIGGLGSSALHPAGHGLARAVHSKNPGLGVALFDAAGMAGGASGPLLVGWLTAAFGSSAVGWAALPALALAALLSWFARRTRLTPTAVRVLPRVKLELLRGPVGLLAIVAVCAHVVTLTFVSAVPLWLVTERGVALSSPTLAFTLATFWAAAATGGLSGAALGRWLPLRAIVSGSLALALLPLQIVLIARPGSLAYFVAVAAAGALIGAQAPLVMTRAQESVPGASSTISGVLFGWTMAIAAIVYAAFGMAQAEFGIGRTIAATFFAVLPAAGVAAWVFRPEPIAPKAEPLPCCTPCFAGA